MKKFFVMLFSFIMLITVFYSICSKIYSKSESPMEILIKCFDYSGAKILSSELFCNINPGDRFNSIEDLGNIAKEYADALNVLKDDSYSCKDISNDLTDRLEINGLTPSNKIVDINAQIIKQNNERNITIKITRDTSSSGLGEDRQVIDKISRKYGMKYSINSSITGYFEGKLDNSQLNDVAVRSFNGIKAKKVEGMNDGGMISVSAYSPNINEYIKAGDKKVNLNMALRYNSYEDRTYIWIATPVITTEY